MIPSAYVVMMLFTALMVAVVVLIHYEGLALLNRQLSRIGRRSHRPVMLYIIFLVILLHLVEITCFAAAYALLSDWPHLGGIAGIPQQLFFDYFYFSIITYSSLGFGDAVAVGAMRFMAGVEGLVGLVLIGWSASFTYLEMQRYWPTRD
jgi:hypothetical protein